MMVDRVTLCAALFVACSAYKEAAVTVSDDASAPRAVDASDPPSPDADSVPRDAASEASDAGRDDVRIVFTTRATFTGALGGVTGADAKCAETAAKSALTRVKAATFRAWLSTSATNAADRLAADAARRISTPDGKLVAPSWTTFASSTHLAPLDVDEHGDKITDNERAWTATNPAGTFIRPGASSTSCADFTGTGTNAIAGDPRDVGVRWTDSGGWACAQASHLYCLEE